MVMFIYWLVGIGWLFWMFLWIVTDGESMMPAIKYLLGIGIPLLLIAELLCQS